MPQQDDKLKDFLKVISQLESSGGTNLSHSGSAMGQYGLMPGTIQEMSNRLKTQGSLTPEMADFAAQSPEDMKASLTPDMEDAYARALAERTMQRQGGNDEMAAYAWRMGHNLSPEEITQRGYQDNSYVNKFRKLKELMKNGK